MIKLFSWNVNGRVDAALDRQADALLGAQPHVVCLQELTPGSEPGWRRRLTDAGLSAIATSTHLIGPGRRYANLIASRWPLTLLPAGEFEIPYLEKVLSAVVAAPTAALELHNAHVPPGVSRPVQKLETLEGIFARLARKALRPRILLRRLQYPAGRARGRQGRALGVEPPRAGRALGARGGSSSLGLARARPQRRLRAAQRLNRTANELHPWRTQPEVAPLRPRVRIGVRAGAPVRLPRGLARREAERPRGGLGRARPAA